MPRTKNKLLICLALGLYLVAGSVAPLFHDAAAHRCTECALPYQTSCSLDGDHHCAADEPHDHDAEHDDSIPTPGGGNEHDRHDSCSVCRFLAQPVDIATVSVTEVATDVVEPVAVSRPVAEPTPLVGIHHSRAPPREF